MCKPSEVWQKSFKWLKKGKRGSIESEGEIGHICPEVWNLSAIWARNTCSIWTLEAIRNVLHSVHVYFSYTESAKCVFAVYAIIRNLKVPGCV